MPLNALTIDVEDYFHVTGFHGRISYSDWDSFQPRIIGSTHRILDILERAEVRGTFFVLGWIADRFRQLVREIARAGHEIASHGYAHQLVTTQSPSQFRSDVRRTKLLLEDQIGRPVTTYRAPSFSISPDHLWAFEVLVEEGYTVDSSVAPGRSLSCGHLSDDGLPFELHTPSGSLKEFPLPVVRRLGRDVPVGGGGYFRLFPYFWTKRALASLNAQGKSFAVYLHPWEFDPEQPRLSAPWARKLKHYVGLHRTKPRFSQLLADFPFDTINSCLAARGAKPLPTRVAA